MKHLFILTLFSLFVSCTTHQKEMERIVFLHHSTGSSIWIGNTNKYVYKLTHKGDVQKFF